MLLQAFSNSNRNPNNFQAFNCPTLSYVQSSSTIHSEEYFMEHGIGSVKI